MAARSRRGIATLVAVVGGALLTAACSGGAATSTGAGSSSSGTPSPSGPASPAAAAGSAAATVSGVLDTLPPPGTNVYAQAGRGGLTGPARTAKSLVYVPDTLANVVDVIDPSTFEVVRTIPVGRVPQHVVPSWDLKTLWVNDNQGDTLVPIDAATGEPGTPVPVVDPYNLYFTPGGEHALVMAEKLQKIYVRDPHTMAEQHVLSVPQCRGVNHADFTADGSMLVASCEFGGRLIVVPVDGSRVAKVIDLNAIATKGATSVAAGVPIGGPAANLASGLSSMPQDVRLAPDGRTFLAADMLRNGVWLIDASTFSVKGFLPTGEGAHGVYPSRDGTRLYVSNRGEGSVSVVDAATLKVTQTWTIPGGGSPDMGGVSADGARLWLSGRYHNVVYVFDTTNGTLLRKIPVHAGPHGLCVWPQPGRFSLGHTGNMR